MAHTDVLLVKPVERLCGEGEQVSVKAGYARNFLFPQKIAIPVNRANKKQIEALIKAREIREANERSEAEKIAARLAEISLAIAVKTGEGGKMFGSVTAQDIINRLEAEGVSISKKQIHLQAVKELDKHVAAIRLHKDIKVDFNFEVVSENPIEE